MPLTTTKSRSKGKSTAAAEPQSGGNTWDPLGILTYLDDGSTTTERTAETSPSEKRVRFSLPRYKRSEKRASRDESEERGQRQSRRRDSSSSKRVGKEERAPEDSEEDLTIGLSQTMSSVGTDGDFWKGPSENQEPSKSLIDSAWDFFGFGTDDEFTTDDDYTDWTSRSGRSDWTGRSDFTSRSGTFYSEDFTETTEDDFTIESEITDYTITSNEESLDEEGSNYGSVTSELAEIDFRETLAYMRSNSETSRSRYSVNSELSNGENTRTCLSVKPSEVSSVSAVRGIKTGEHEVPGVQSSFSEPKSCLRKPKFSASFEEKSPVNSIKERSVNRESSARANGHTERRNKSSPKLPPDKSVSCLGRKVYTDQSSTLAVAGSRSSSKTPKKPCMPTRLRAIPEEKHHGNVSGRSTSHRSKTFRALLCRSQKHTVPTKLPKPSPPKRNQVSHSSSSREITAISKMTQSENEDGSFPVARIVPDNDGPSKKEHRFDGEGVLASNSGPQSVYTYEYEEGTPMDVSYRNFGYDPVELIRVREYNIPQAVFGGSTETIIKVEASTISPSDCRIRQGLWWGEESPALPNTPGVDMVGRVYKIDPWTAAQYKILPGDRVMSLIKWGGNSRYARVEANQLVKVPKDVDPSEATCLAEAYLAAFQALQHGQMNDNVRYQSHSMIGKSVLIIGATTNTGRAIVELAKALGAANVYAIDREKKHPLLESIGAIPLSRKWKSWLPKVTGMMDLVIDATGDIEGDHANAGHFNALHEQGHLLFVGLRGMTDEVAEEWDVTADLYDPENAARIIDRTHSLEVFDNWDLDLERSKRDLEHLLQLMQKNMIKPIVRDRLPLGKVAKAQALLDVKQIQGYLVCEPWIKSKSRAVIL